MASIQFTIFLVAFILLHSVDPFAKIQGRVEDGGHHTIPTQWVEVLIEGKTGNFQQETHLPLVGKRIENEEQRELVRKKMRKGDFRTVKEEVTATNAAIFNQRKRENLKVKHKLMGKREIHHRLGEKASGLIAFSADYYIPKPHPPKSN